MLQQACGGELPTPAEAARFDGVIIGGSHYSAYEEHQWINKMLELLPQYVAQGARIYGCCFGCQVGFDSWGSAAQHRTQLDAACCQQLHDFDYHPFYDMASCWV